MTREDGTYVFTPIRTGAYTIDVEFQGFKKAVRRGITVSIQQQALVDFTLQPGGLTDEIVVTAETPLLQTGSGTVGETLKSDALEDLPINGATTRRSPGWSPASCRRSPARARR